MCRYLVAEAHDAWLELLLLDGHGHLHLVSVNEPALTAGSVLHGPVPGLGFVWLQCEGSARVHGSHFIELACQRAPVLRRWQTLAPLQVLPKRDVAATTQVLLASPDGRAHFANTSL